MKKYLVFLDIDGVFTSSRVHTATNAEYDMWHKFDPIAVDFMNWIHDTYNVEFVLISTWKNNLAVDNPNIFHWIAAAFGNAGFKGKFHHKWKTDPDETWVNKSTLYNRAQEIKEFLEAYPIYDDYIIFDDNDYGFKKVLGINRFVKTNPENGLLHKHMLNAKSLMGTWEKKNA